MDFKTRFQGKMQKISKDGGIDDMVLASDKPINPLKKVTIRSLHDQEAEQNLLNSSQRITYGSATEKKEQQTNIYMQQLPR